MQTSPSESPLGTPNIPEVDQNLNILVSFKRGKLSKFGIFSVSGNYSSVTFDKI